MKYSLQENFLCYSVQSETAALSTTEDYVPMGEIVKESDRETK